MIDPCKRHIKRKVTAYRAVQNDSRTMWGIGERRDCVRCGDSVVRLARGTFGKTAREALQAYGCTREEVEAYVAAHFPEEAARDRLQAAAAPVASKAVECPLTCWPFPVSAHVET
jgi:hypothetical protein